jgi:hypothetical protein
MRAGSFVLNDGSCGAAGMDARPTRQETRRGLGGEHVQPQALTFVVTLLYMIEDFGMFILQS